MEETFSKREWIFVLIIISIAQCVIWYVSFVNAGNASALTYVSFAGTLISIILAVLAIGYTYGESVSQKNKTDNVASQISTLNDVIQNVRDETKSLENISIISSQLNDFANIFESEMKSTNDTVASMNKSIGEILKDSESTKDVPTDDESTLFDNDEFINKLLNPQNVLYELCIYFTVHFVQSCLVHHITELPNFIEKLMEEPEFQKTKTGNDIVSLFKGGSVTLLIQLENFNLIETDTISGSILRNKVIDRVHALSQAEDSHDVEFAKIIKQLLIKKLIFNV